MVFIEIKNGERYNDRFSMQFDFLKSIKTVDIKSINRPTQQWELGKQD